jgi:hypothetical protein
MSTDQQQKICFVVGPLGDPDSDTRVHADWVLEEIIEPVLSKFSGFTVVRADQIAPPGMIDAQVIQHLLDSALVIADLSKENPNAFYEIGIRHMAQKPIIHMQLIEEKIPFDVSLYRTLKFSRTKPSDLRKAREELQRAVAAVLVDGYKVDNPVTRARGQIKLEEDATPQQKVLFDQLRAIQYRLDRIEAFDGPLPGEDDREETDVDFIEYAKDVTAVIFNSRRRLSEKERKELLALFPPDIVQGFTQRGLALEVRVTRGFPATQKWNEISRHAFKVAGLQSIAYSRREHHT